VTTVINKNSGFTIVELLVVIVVIAILAAITIVSYTGISSRANNSALQSDLTNASQQLKMYYTLYGSYPTIDSVTLCPTAPIVDNKYCLKASHDVTYTYQADNSNSSQTFYITATKDSQSYTIMPSGAPSKGNNLDYGLLLNLNAGNSASYPGSGTAWTDLSGNDSNGTLMNGIGYSSAGGGSLSFDGVDDFVSTTNVMYGRTKISMGGWIKRATTSSSMSFGAVNGTAERSEIVFYGNGSLYGEVSSSHEINGSKAVSNDTNWHYIMMVFDGNGATNPDRIKLYFDGFNVGPLIFTGTIGSSVACSNNFTIGTRSTGFSSGLVGEIYIYNRVLIPGEVAQNFNATKGRYGL